MENFYKNMGFIIGFLILIIVIQTAFGGETSADFLVIVLLSMLVLNYKKFGDFTRKVFD